MLDLQSKPHPFLSNFRLVQDILRTHGPALLHELRELRLRRFEETGIPGPKDEEFKYVPLKVLETGDFHPAYGANVERSAIEATPLGGLDAITVTFVNGEHAPELSSIDVLPEGVFIGTLAEALEIDEALVMSKLGTIAQLEGRLGTTNDERFVDLNTAYLGEGAVVIVPKSAVVDRPIHLQFVFDANHGPMVSHPRSLIILGENAQAMVVESYVGLGGIYFTNAVTEISLAPNAILDHVKFQQERLDSVHIANSAIHQEANSTYRSTVANFGGRIVRNDLNVWINGEHTETSLDGVSVGLGDQVVDNHTRIDHAKPNCHSFEVYKSILGDRATGVFNGKIFVYEDAQKTDAKQTNQAMLLSPTATINTKPQLEIFADDVKCTHGATVGQLREDALFYLRARGIPLAQARAILVYAFAAEVLEKISNETVREALERVLFERLSEAEALPSAS